MIASRRTDAEMKAEMRAALLSPDSSHTRCHSVNPDSVSAYRYGSGPTGVRLIMSLDAALFRELVAEMREDGVRLHGGHSPLSPTEKR